MHHAFGITGGTTRIADPGNILAGWLLIQPRAIRQQIAQILTKVSLGKCHHRELGKTAGQSHSTLGKCLRIHDQELGPRILDNELLLDERAQRMQWRVANTGAQTRRHNGKSIDPISSELHQAIAAPQPEAT